MMHEYKLKVRNGECSAAAGYKVDIRHTFRAAILTTLGCASLLAQSVPTNCNRAQPDSRPLALVVTGGTSKGAYQAGALWAFLQYERQIRETKLTEAVEIPVISGASAGNVNALIAATEWARPIARNRDETQSLLWQAWTNVGLPNLLRRSSNERKPFLSILNPEAFDSVADSIKALVDSDGFLPCEIAIGVTLTRSDSVAKYPIRDVRNAVVLRHASLAIFRSTASGFNLDTMPSIRALHDLGIAISPQHDSSGHLVLDSYFEHVRASAAFPIAFPPRRVSFSRIENRRRRTPASTGVFVDGGVFDNEPMSLARSLLATSRDSSNKRCEDGAARQFGTCQIHIVSPNRRRTIRNFEAGADNRVLPDAESAVNGPDSVANLRAGVSVYFGLSDYVQFAKHALKSATDNEAVAFERTMPRGTWSCDYFPVTETCVVASSRYFPIFGALAMSFGAFFGRPLREADFYVGVYDGLARVVGQHKCAAFQIGEVRTSCVTSNIGRLLDDPTDLPELSSAGRRIVASLLRAERDSLPPESRAELDRITDPREQDIRKALSALRTSQSIVDSATASSTPIRVKRRLQARLCRFQNSILGVFCRDGLLLALSGYHQLGGYSDFASRGDSGTAKPEYFADSTFLSILHAPEREALQIARSVFLRLGQMEVQDRSGATRTVARRAFSTLDFIAGKGLNQTNVSGWHQLSSVSRDKYAARSNSLIGHTLRTASPLSLTFGSRSATTLHWAPVGAVYLRGNAVAPIVAARTGGSAAAGFRFQSRSVHAKWFLPNAIHARAERALGTPRADAIVDVQAMWFGRTIGLGLEMPVERRRRSRSRSSVVASVNDISALMRILISR
jgi:Patatin-like phospholipase